MQKKLTISIDADVYAGLYRKIGARRIGQFIEDLVRPHVLEENLEAEYAEMAADEESEAEALEWNGSNRHLNRVQVVPLTRNVKRVYSSEAVVHLNGQVRKRSQIRSPQRASCD